MISVYIVYNDPQQALEFKNTIFKQPFLVEYIDTTTRHGKKEGWKLKEYWGAKVDPFCIIFDGDTPKKAFYSENDWEDNAIVQLINYLQNEDSSNTQLFSVTLGRSC